MDERGALLFGAFGRQCGRRDDLVARHEGSGRHHYSLYQDSARTQNWGSSIGVDTVAGTGTGLTQSVSVYGRVAAQTTPAAGTYTDTIVVTVTY